MRFTKAIVRPPGPSMVHGLTSASLGPPDYKKALRQHAAYADALRACGLEVIGLEPVDEYPDSTFVEDVALLTTECAVITRPGAPSRRGEIQLIEPVLRDFCNIVERVEAPGTLDGGDVMMVGSHFYIGLSERSNTEGANQLIRILESHGMTGSTVPLKSLLHLKSASAYLDGGNFVLAGELLDRPEFAGDNTIRVEDEEAHAANCLWLNGTVLVASGFPKIKREIAARGYKTLALDMSEFRKLDGGLSCLSLRF